MVGQHIAARAVAIIDRVGETMTLRRPGSPDVDVTVKASRFGAASSEAVQGQTTTRFQVRISNAAIAAQTSYTLPVRVGLDQIVDSDGRAYVIMECDTKKPGEVVAMHVLTVEG